MRSAFAFSCLLSLAFACDHVDVVAHGPGFGYNELQGPLNWYGLNKTNNSKCALGKNQSPINIDPNEVGDGFPVKAAPGSSLGFDIQDYPQGAILENLGNTLEVIANGTLKRGGKEYSLKQFHFHTPSEHRINSEYYPMEVHFVFKTTGRWAVTLAVRDA